MGMLMISLICINPFVFRFSFGFVWGGRVLSFIIIF